MTSKRDFGERGLQAALDRLTVALGDKTSDPLIPLAEALEWSYALQEYHLAEIRKAKSVKDPWPLFNPASDGRRRGKLTRP